MPDTIEGLKDRLKNGESASGLVHTVGKHIEVTTTELAEAVKTNPDHPVALAYSGCVKAFADAPDHKHCVDSVDLQALLDNKEVVVSATVEGGIKKVRKSLGNSRARSFAGPSE